ncbi:neurofilament medium polypeptide-like [Plakobranchus ocellatus]|uniref:Neurofilament medium polypeptide-like n=1 Tax=Plakobranchus ocellatus TaxID=259542 RepID=A0AAV4C396_9GAST|nr:neurofilament medium polypeptide-like [Plakobranchus ocellatus]
MSQGPVLARGPGGRLRTATTTGSNSNKNYNNTHYSNKSTANTSRSAGQLRSKPQPSGLVGLYVAPGMGDAGSGSGNSENLAPFRYHRSARPGARRQMAIECGLKSLPVNTKWVPAGRNNLAMDMADQGSVTQNQVYLQAPDGNVSSRRGLSGSKVRQTPVTSRPGSQTPRSSSLPGGDQQEHFQLQHPQHHQQQQPQLFAHQHQNYTETVGYPISPSPRPQSKRFTTRLSSAPAAEDEGVGLVRHYKWNSSDQGVRLRRQLSSLSSCRSMKRASEMVSHRLDPMYLMSGSKVPLQNRYGIDEHEMKRLQEMTQIREGLMSDLKKMKFPYGARASKHVVVSL